MNIFLLGNGFDRHYSLPTDYADFLNTFDHLCKNQSDSINTVGDVFRELSKDEKNKRIRESYEKYGKCFDSTNLPQDEIVKLTDKAKENSWFQYFVKCKCKIKGQGWIDFEKEIKRVLALIEKIFKYAYSGADPERSSSSIETIPIQYQSDIRTILIDFGLGTFGAFINDKDGEGRSKRFFIDETTEIKTDYESIKGHFHLRFYSGKNRDFYFRHDLNIPYPETPGILSLNEDAIVDELLSSLQEFSKLLTSYLYLFIERPLMFFIKEGIVQRDSFFESEAVVLSLNYTRTYEMIYCSNDFESPLSEQLETIIDNGYHNSTICHIHGITKSPIVLGIDSDSKDKLNELDTRFLGFKKYYQRVVYKTDSDYLRLLPKIRAQREKYDLFIFGHSLDETDREIIKELFDLAYTISIFYYTQNDLKDYVRRLISIYGKEEFDRIRVSKELTFFHTDELNHNWRILCQGKVSSLI